MASVTPRMSGLWSSEYFREPMGEDIEEQEQELGQDGRSALDRTIDRIGMGSSVFNFSVTPILSLFLSTAIRGRIC